MKLLSSPLVVIILSLLSGMGAGLYWYWQAAQIIAAEVKLELDEKEGEHIEAPPPPWDFWTVELENLSRELEESRKALAVREAEVTRREQRILAERGEVDATLQQVEALRKQIGDQILAVQREELRNLKSLASTYSALTPAAAVAIFDQLDDIMVTKILSLMKTEATAAILEEMSQGGMANEARLKRAAAISQRLRLLVPAK